MSFPTNYGARRGIIDVCVIEARDLKNCNFIRSMDPYCKVTVNGVTKQTGVHDNGHKNPAWNGTLESMLVGNVDGEVATFELWDKDSMGSDDLIAQGEISISEIANAAADNEMSDELKITLQPQGELRIKGKFILDDATAETEARSIELHNYGKRRGIIDLNVIEASGLKSINFIRSMDPFVKVSVNGTTKESQHHENGHKNPRWNEQIGSMMVGNIDADQVTVELWDKGSLGSDDKICVGTLPLSALANAACDNETSAPVVIKLDPQGELKITGKFTLDSATAKEDGEPTSVPAATQPQMGVPQMGVHTVSEGESFCHGAGAAPAPKMFAVDVDGDGIPDFVCQVP